MKPGTPPGMQLEFHVNATLPANTSSLPFFIASFTQGFRFGFVRSAMRKVGCLPTPLGTKGCAGSWVTGPGTRPGTGSKKGPPPLSPTHPYVEKSGAAGFCCARASAIRATAINPAKMLAANTCCLELNEDMSLLLPQVY